MPSTFEDLDKLCIHAQNVAYEDDCRRTVRIHPAPQGRMVNNVSSPNIVKCYNCNRLGHIARNCYRRQGNFTSNYRGNETSSAPKNGQGGESYK